MIQESSEDRALALASYKYFKDRVDVNFGDRDQREVISVAEKCMVDSLKIANDARFKAVKLLDILAKFELKENKPVVSTESEIEDEAEASFDEINDL